VRERIEAPAGSPDSLTLTPFATGGTPAGQRRARLPASEVHRRAFDDTVDTTLWREPVSSSDSSST